MSRWIACSARAAGNRFVIECSADLGTTRADQTRFRQSLNPYRSGRGTKRALQSGAETSAGVLATVSLKRGKNGILDLEA